VYKPSLRSRMLEWVFWRIRAKSRFEKTDGFRETTIKSRPSNPRPPRSIYRRYNVVENTQHGSFIFTGGATHIRLWGCSGR
jgi:hypothetical protein